VIARLREIELAQKREELVEIEKKFRIVSVERSELSSLRSDKEVFERKGNLLFVSDRNLLEKAKKDEFHQLNQQREQLKSELKSKKK